MNYFTRNYYLICDPVQDCFNCITFLPRCIQLLQINFPVLLLYVGNREFGAFLLQLIYTSTTMT